MVHASLKYLLAIDWIARFWYIHRTLLQAVCSSLVDDFTVVKCAPTMMALGMCLRGLFLSGRRY